MSGFLGAELREAKEGYFGVKGKKLGEFILRVIYHVYVFRVVLDALECINWRFIAFCRVFWKFPETAWRAAHASIAYFLGLSMHRLAAMYCPPDGTNCLVQFSRIFGCFL